MKARLWPALLFGVALTGLHLTSGCTLDGCGDNERPVYADRDSAAESLCSLLYCDSLHTVGAAQRVMECKRDVLLLWEAEPVAVTWECVDYMDSLTDSCPEFRPLPSGVCP